MSSNPVVMLVVDDSMTRAALKHDLKVLGLNVLLAPTTKTGWKLLENGPLPDLLLLDVFLPRRDGPNFLERIRSDSRFSALSVILFPIIIEFSSWPDPSKDVLFVPSGNPKARVIHPFVSKNGNHKTNTIPPELVFLIGSSFQKKNIKPPFLFQVEMERCSNRIFQNIDTGEAKSDG